MNTVRLINDDEKLTFSQLTSTDQAERVCVTQFVSTNSQHRP